MNRRKFLPDFQLRLKIEASVHHHSDASIYRNFKPLAVDDWTTQGHSLTEQCCSAFKKHLILTSAVPWARSRVSSTKRRMWAQSNFVQLFRRQSENILLSDNVLRRFGTAINILPFQSNCFLREPSDQTFYTLWSSTMILPWGDWYVRSGYLFIHRKLSSELCHSWKSLSRNAKVEMRRPGDAGKIQKLYPRHQSSRIVQPVSFGKEGCLLKWRRILGRKSWNRKSSWMSNCGRMLPTTPTAACHWSLRGV